MVMTPLVTLCVMCGIPETEIKGRWEREGAKGHILR